MVRSNTKDLSKCCQRSGYQAASAATAAPQAGLGHCPVVVRSLQLHWRRGRQAADPAESVIVYTGRAAIMRFSVTTEPHPWVSKSSTRTSWGKLTLVVL